MAAPTKGQRTAVIADLDKAVDLVKDLCAGRARWVMSIPARPDHDPDLVIARALYRARSLIEAEQEAAHG